MTQIEKILARLTNPPPEVKLSEVLKVLEKFGFEIDHKRGSHIVASHPSLINQRDFGKNGEFTIPTVSGKYVKKWYVKEIINAISIIEEMQES